MLAAWIVSCLLFGAGCFFIGLGVGCNIGRRALRNVSRELDKTLTLLRHR